MHLSNSDLISYLGTIIDYRFNMRHFTAVLLIFFAVNMGLNAQLNNYKYIVVPIKFQGFKNDNQFRTSTLVKYLFANEGFTTVYGNAMPDELRNNPCLGLQAELINESGLLATKTQISLIDCNGALIMMSQEGKSKVKEYEQAYREAISESFGSFRGLNYSYTPPEDTKSDAPITVSFKNDVKTLEENTSSAVETAKEKVMPEATVISDNVASKKQKDVLYAQPIENGYQLVDASPKVVYVLKKTSAPDVYLVNTEGKNGIIYKNEGKWFIEMDDKNGKAKELNIKF